MISWLGMRIVGCLVAWRRAWRTLSSLPAALKHLVDSVSALRGALMPCSRVMRVDLLALVQQPSLAAMGVVHPVYAASPPHSFPLL